MIGYTVEIKAYKNCDDYNCDSFQFDRENYMDILFIVKMLVCVWSTPIKSIAIKQYSYIPIDKYKTRVTLLNCFDCFTDSMGNINKFEFCNVSRVL